MPDMPQDPETRVWVDIDNPPQVQYLVPFVHEFERRGCRVLITVRRHGIAQDLAAQRGLRFVPVGSRARGGTLRKVAAVLGRARELQGLIRAEQPSLAVFASRSAAMTAAALRISGFALIDYEYVDLRAFRLARSVVVHPRCIQSGLREQRIPLRRLLPYDGLKEHISCADVDLDTLTPLSFDGVGSAMKVLVRPPDEHSHYFSARSREMTRATLKWLGERGVAVILSPRHPHQRQLLEGIRWDSPPVVLEGAVPFDRLLASVDAVVTAGGTMAREAAFLGVPAYSVFQGRAGGVDLDLETRGRLTLLRTPADLDHLVLAAERQPRMSGVSPVQHLVDAMLGQRS